MRARAGARRRRIRRRRAELRELPSVGSAGPSNRALQAKLTVGRRDDPLEHEAERSAERVAAGETADLRREAGGIGPPLQSRIGTGGRPLSEAERGYFEPRFGQDLSAVRLHTDRAASQAARSLGAEAFALGGDIAFAEGAFAPDTRAGRRVLAHELSHVVQGERGGERGAASVLRRRPLGGLEEREPFRDPRGRGAHGAHGTLPYREATRLADCIRILGESQAAFCRHDVLGEPLPTPRFKSLANITSPVPFAATVSARGSASVSIGGVDATFLPDRRSRSRRMRNRAETNFRFAPMPIRARTGRGRVTSFTGPGRAHVTIRTTYGPGARRTTPSAYGRGTTAADIAAGDTSLGFHEGRHGVDYVNFLENNAFPTFTGKVGMTTAEFRAAMAAFRTAVRDYRVRMAQRSLLNTDCVGTTIDAHNASRGRITTRCVVP